MLVSKYEHQLRPKKITTKKKGTVVWPAMFLEPPEKITTQKTKRYSHLTDEWNKSQINVCRFKIQTHQLRLEKIMTGKKGTTQSSGRLSCQNANTTNHTII